MKRYNKKKHQKSDVYRIPNKIVFSPTSNTLSEEIKNSTESKNFIKIDNQSKLDVGKIIDKIFSEDFLIIGLIALLIFEVINLKKDNADSNTIYDYELMIAVLIYIYF